MTRSVDFFDRQFQSQARAGDYVLNPFERAVLPHVQGEVLDLGCGIGNFALAAAEAGCRVTALDASRTAVADLSRRARQRGLPIEARVQDLRHYAPPRAFDAVVCIGLLMFFACPDARALLARLPAAVRPGGVAAINVLVEGTTFTDMFEPGDYCLFGRDELAGAFGGWQCLISAHEDFPAPGGMLKRFHTFAARRP